MSDVQEGAAWVGFDLGGTKMLATIYDSRFRALGSKRRKTKGYDGVDAGLTRIATTIEAAMEAAGVRKNQLQGIGLACPGPLDLNEGIALETPNLGWKNVPVASVLQKQFGCPVVLINDVDAGVYGEYRFGAGRSARCLLGVFPGTGIGGGCVYEGNIFRGKTGSCMEIGHLQVVPDGPICGCGRRGCLEAVASRLAIAAAAAQAAYRGEAPHLLAAAGTEITAIRSGHLVEAIAAGDRVVERIVRVAAEHIGCAVASVVNLLSPDIVVLGGGLVEAMPKLMVEAVAKSAKARVMPSFESTFKVVAAELGDEASVKGAAAWVREVVSTDRSTATSKVAADT